MRKKKGDKYGKLVIVADTGERTHRGEKKFLCRCDCGNEIVVASSFIERKYSCGCSSRLYHCGTYLPNIHPDRKLQKNNTSGCTGVMRSKRTGKWIARIKLQRHVHDLGSFTTYNDAVCARKAAEQKYFTPIIQKYGME